MQSMTSVLNNVYFSTHNAVDNSRLCISCQNCYRFIVLLKPKHKSHTVSSKEDYRTNMGNVYRSLDFLYFGREGKTIFIDFNN